MAAVVLGARHWPKPPGTARSSHRGIRTANGLRRRVDRTHCGSSARREAVHEPRWRPADGALNSAVIARPLSSTRAGQPSAAHRAAIAATIAGSVIRWAVPSTTRSNSSVATLSAHRASRFSGLSG
ncbi:hypothetical protein I553_6209 [Mycobacterium xenopi 4042]|uniref:Uncharacterized protein n=1 Tax=Mycobacterium xenopi 4042 TaxID=1299334 RepID=X8BET6_MYCXE|nr:hypothetical protein I553_6209 [Mycobacterium xenopi 4042]